MDIFLGSSRKLAFHLLEKSDEVIQTLDDSYKCDNSELIALWQKTGDPGETITCRINDYQVIFDGYINNINGSTEAFLPFLVDRISQNKEVLKHEETGIFNIAIIDTLTHSVFLASDPGALLPLYYTLQNDTFFFFSHSYIFSEVLNLPPDPLGILTKLIIGYTFGSRTLFSSLHRINPGEIVEFQQAENRFKIHSGEKYYTEYVEHGKDLEKIVWDCLQKPFRSYPNDAKKIGIMLSEGFDSRLVAGLAKSANLEISAFTHGTPGTKGTNITFAVAQNLSAKYCFDPLNSGLPSNEIDIKKQLYLSDNLSIPYWINGSRYFSRSDVDFVAVGTALDSTLGGHTFFRPKNPRMKAVSQRYSEIILQNTSLLSEEYVENLSSELLENYRNACASPKNIKVLKSTFNSSYLDQFNPLVGKILPEFDQELDRLKNTGSLSSSQVLQRFFLEHRARKFSFGQELTLRINNKLVVPSYEPLTMRVLSSIHPKYKLQHNLYLSLLRKHLPALFNIPNGGYGLPVQYPRLLLETSRFLQKYSEMKLTRRYIESKGNVNIDQLRAVTFIESTYRNGAAIDYFMDFFQNNANIFNSSAIVSELRKIINYESKSYALMDCFSYMEILYSLSHM